MTMTDPMPTIRSLLGMPTLVPSTSCQDALHDDCDATSWQPSTASFQSCPCPCHTVEGQVAA